MLSSSPSRASVVSLLAFGLVATIGTALAAPMLFRLSPGTPGCDAPIRYSIGDVDGRFPLDKKAVRSVALETERVWEQGIGKDVFVYDPQATFHITAVFDDRQKMTEDARALEERVASYETEAATIGDQHAEMLVRYERDRKRFEKDVAEYEKDLAVYNAEVAKWNNQGGAPPEEYEKLEDARKNLEEESDRLEKTSQDLQKLAQQVNTLAKTIGAKADTVNENIAKFKERYGNPQPFVQGLYTPPLSSIQVFQFEGRDDLRLVLAHEFGHALGIEEHVPYSRSIMHYLMGGQDMTNPHLTEEDVLAYTDVCQNRKLSPREEIVRYLVLPDRKDMDPPPFLRNLVR